MDKTVATLRATQHNIIIIIIKGYLFKQEWIIYLCLNYTICDKKVKKSNFIESFCNFLGYTFKQITAINVESHRLYYHR